MAMSPLVMTVERDTSQRLPALCQTLSGTEDMHDMDLDASAMDQDSERPGEGSLCDSGK